MLQLYHKNKLQNKLSLMITIKTKKELKSYLYTITRFLNQHILTLSLNMLVQFPNATFAFQARSCFFPYGTASAIQHNWLINRISLMCQCLLVQWYGCRLCWLWTTYLTGHNVVIHGSMHDYCITGFITFSFITSSTNCASRIASSSNATVELEVILKYLSFW